MASCRSISIVAGIGLAACSPGSSKLDHVGRAAIDGELDEPAWNQRAIRGVFSDRGAQARPYSEIRVLRDEGHLLVGLYAADEDIRSDDAFELSIGTYRAALTAGGRASPDAIRIAVDRDGTLDDPSDNDEEWVVEAALPLSDLGPPPLDLGVRRCDRTKPGETRCGSWQRTLDPATIPAIE